MPMKVTITLTRDAEKIRIRDRYRNDRVLFEGENLPAWKKISLDQVTTTGSPRRVGKLQITAKVKNDRDEWELRDEPLTVTGGWHEWPPTGGMVQLIRMLVELPEIPDPAKSGQEPGRSR